MPIGVRADPAYAERVSRPLRLALVLLGVGTGCTPSAGSPIELGPGANQTPDAGGANECWAREYPILFQRSGGSSDLEVQLYLSSGNGSDALRIARGAAYHSAVWAPDGRSIAFRKRSATDFGTVARTDIGIMAPNGTEQVLLLADQIPPASPAGMFGPTWAPDGQTIAIASPRDSMGSALWVLSRFGGQPRRLMPESESSESDPSWSRRDPNRIAYVLADGDAADIWQVNVSDPADRQNLTLGRALHPRVPRWSPDGQQLAFAAEDPLPRAEGGGDQEVYIWTAATSDIARVTDNDDFDMSPVWSPDGRSLLMMSNRLPDSAPLSASRRNALWFVPLDSTDPPRVLGGTSGQITGSDWYWSTSCDTAP